MPKHPLQLLSNQATLVGRENGTREAMAEGGGRAGWKEIHDNAFCFQTVPLTLAALSCHFQPISYDNKIIASARWNENVLEPTGSQAGSRY